jgi:hypothetical protein
VSDYINTSNVIKFAIVNSDPALASCEIGFNYAGVVLNGWPVALLSTDAFTYREPTTGAGYTGSITLAEV